jgi:hypothetical protein
MHGLNRQGKPAERGEMKDPQLGWLGEGYPRSGTQCLVQAIPIVEREWQVERQQQAGQVRRPSQDY